MQTSLILRLVVLAIAAVVSVQAREENQVLDIHNGINSEMESIVEGTQVKRVLKDDQSRDAKRNDNDGGGSGRNGRSSRRRQPRRRPRRHQRTRCDQQQCGGPRGRLYGPSRGSRGRFYGPRRKRDGNQDVYVHNNDDNDDNDDNPGREPVRVKDKRQPHKLKSAPKRAVPPPASAPVPPPVARAPGTDPARAREHEDTSSNARVARASEHEDASAPTNAPKRDNA